MQRKTGRLCSHGRGGGERTRRTGGRRRASAGRLIRRDGCVELSLIRWALGVESEKKKTVVVRVLCSAGKIVVHAFGALRVCPERRRVRVRSAGGGGARLDSGEEGNAGMCVGERRKKRRGEWLPSSLRCLLVVAFASRNVLALLHTAQQNAPTRCIYLSSLSTPFPLPPHMHTHSPPWFSILLLVYRRRVIINTLLGWSQPPHLSLLH